MHLRARVIPTNPNYEEGLAAYNEHVMLVSDMIFELVRLTRETHLGSNANIDASGYEIR